MIHQRLVEVHEATLEVFIFGDDAPVLCTTHQWHAAMPHVETFVRNPFVQVLEGIGSVIWVNLRGAGGSSPAKSSTDLSMHQAVEDLEVLRQQLGRTGWMFAGSSAGGFIGLLYALRYPAALAGLILCCSAPSGLFRDDPDCIYNPARRDFADIQDIRERAYQASASPDDVRRWAELVYHSPASVEEHVARAAHARQHDSIVTDVVSARLSMMRSELDGRDGLDRYDVTDRLRDIRLPTLILHGRHDVNIPLRWGELIHQRVANSEFVVFEDSGHLPDLEEPEKFREAVIGFVNRVAPTLVPSTADHIDRVAAPNITADCASTQLDEPPRFGPCC